VLGFMAEKTKVEIDQLAVGGPGLSFIGKKFTIFYSISKLKLHKTDIFDSI
jgi:hypothetical protein